MLPWGLAVATLANFFLASDFSEVDAVVLDVVGHFDKKNPVPMILGETLNGLDEMKEGGCIYFKGSPLFVWV